MCVCYLGRRGGGFSAQQRQLQERPIFNGDANIPFARYIYFVMFGRSTIFEEHVLFPSLKIGFLCQRSRRVQGTNYPTQERNVPCFHRRLISAERTNGHGIPHRCRPTPSARHPKFVIRTNFAGGGRAGSKKWREECWDRFPPENDICFMRLFC